MSHNRADAWDASPCGLLCLAADGTVVDANAALLSWVGRDVDELAGRVRLSELLSVGGRIYWETHLSPMLHADGRVDEVAVELRTARGRLPVHLAASVDQPSGLVHVVLSRASERSRYERDLLLARRAAERAAAQSRVLQSATAALSRGGTVDAVVAAALAAATGPLGGRAATFWLVTLVGDLVIGGVVGEPAGTAPLPRVPLTSRSAVVDADRVLVPVHGQARIQGVLSVAPREEPGADPVDHHVLTAIGQQAGLALDRALMYEESAQVAHQLQRALLATRMPSDSRYTVATSYRPGVERLEVGGDWYDAFPIEGDVLSVAVGDVVGRGLGAAIAMGQLRSAVRAVAGPGVGPAALLGQLDRFVQQVPPAVSATLAYAEVDLGSGRVRYACGGHPPPLLMPADGEPQLVWDGRSTPLGVAVPGKARTQAELELRAGDRLLLYTDGLIERRGRSLKVGLERLQEAAAQLRGLDPEQTVADLTTTLLRDERGRDDVCLLLLSWH
ncbi:SpoIIE family protein phosphatase [Georgenia faecalis]|uniref:SpoIIE family protein phosphatase n=1 Tax=Georgenia faecalis TaxID=2483799 RepID=UPI000FD8D681|nr:SpoIIE family protein phosphatase [Georgenia faecalis]